MNNIKKISVSVESLQDITEQILIYFSNEVIDHIPNDPQQQREVMIHLQEYLNDTIDMMSSSITVNDLSPISNAPLSQLIQDKNIKMMEPFDSELNEQLRKQYENWEDLSIRALELRKLSPVSINNIYDKLNDEYLCQLDERIESLEQEQKRNKQLLEEGESTETSETLDSEETQNLSESLTKMQKSVDELSQIRANLNKLGQLTRSLGS